MDLLEAMQSTWTCRRFKTDAVPDAVLRRALAAARFAPQGGNRQPVRWILVRDPDRKRQLKEWYLEPWSAYVAAAREGAIKIGGATRLIDAADYFAQHLDQVPVIAVVCAETASLHATDLGLDRNSVVGGASIYPTVQNFLLACRAEGLGTALTTLLCAAEPRVKALLEIPAEFLTAAHVAVGWPAQPFPRRLARRPIEGAVFLDRFGAPAFAA